MNMTAAEALSALNETGDPDLIDVDWEQSEDTAVPSFLTQRQIIDSLEWCGFTHAFESILIDTARLITRNPALLRLARHCAWSVYDNPESRELQGWPTFEASMGDRAVLMFMLIALGAVPYIRNHHERMSIPESVTRETCRQIRCFCETYQQHHDGKPGIQGRRISWLRHYVREPYFRVGRLEYWLKANPTRPHVFRSRRSGQTLALVWEDQPITVDGYPARGDSDEGTWEPYFRETPQGVEGFPISPFGQVVRRPITLSSKEWDSVLAQGDPVLQVHIPSGDPATPESIRQSKIDAVTFFHDHFPDANPRAFVSTSWMFSDLLDQLLPETSNVVRYLRELYLFPIPSGKYGGLSFIFPDEPFDPDTAKAETHLQRAILDHLHAGRRWHSGGMFMMLDDLKHYGSQHYRKTWRLSEFSE